jgi:hypothetical protein
MKACEVDISLLLVVSKVKYSSMGFLQAIASQEQSPPSQEVV